MAIRVVAALLWDGGRLLACQRRAAGPFPLKWEFPGGKIEPGETPLAALQRELREELGIEILGAVEISRHRHLYADGTDVELIFSLVKAYEGVMVNRVFKALRWVKIQDLVEMDFLEGDHALIQRLAAGEIVLAV